MHIKRLFLSEEGHWHHRDAIEGYAMMLFAPYIGEGFILIKNNAKSRMVDDYLIEVGVASTEPRLKPIRSCLGLP